MNGEIFETTIEVLMKKAARNGAAFL